jgi:uncharacterized protein YggE
MFRVHSMLLVGVCLAANVGAALAAETAAVPPQIVVSGRAEKRIPADRAALQIAVETKAQTADTAGLENARVQQAVLEALQRVGVDSKNITTAGYSVTQDFRYERGEQPPKPDGYTARNTIRVEATRLDQIGRLLDAALAAGANRIDGIDFMASTATEARRALLAAAIANARADAEEMAKAAGGSLGSLIELSTERPQQPVPLRLRAMAAPSAVGGAQTQITPREILVEAVVFARWQFVPAKP